MKWQDLLKHYLLRNGNKSLSHQVFLLLKKSIPYKFQNKNIVTIYKLEKD